MFDTENEESNIEKEHKQAQESGDIFDSRRHEQM